MAPQEAYSLLRAAQERSIPVHPPSAKAALDKDLTRAPWASEYLSPSSLLIQEELELYVTSTL